MFCLMIILSRRQAPGLHFRTGYCSVGTGWWENFCNMPFQKVTALAGSAPPHWRITKTG